MIIRRLFPLLFLPTTLVIILIQGCSQSEKPTWVDRIPTAPDSIYAVGISKYKEEALVSALVDLALEKGSEDPAIIQESARDYFRSLDNYESKASKNMLTFRIGKVTIRSLVRTFRATEQNKTVESHFEKVVHLEFNTGKRHYSFKSFHSGVDPAQELEGDTKSAVSNEENASFRDVVVNLREEEVGLNIAKGREQYYVLASAALNDLGKFQQIGQISKRPDIEWEVLLNAEKALDELSADQDSSKVPE